MPESKKKLLVSLLLLALVVPSWMLWGWAFMLLWSWYAMPLGLPAVGIWHACGLSTLWSLISLRPSREKTAAQKQAEEDETAGEFAKRMLAVMLAPLYILAIGYLMCIIGGVPL